VNPNTVVLHVGGMRFATERAAIKSFLGRRPGVLNVEANPSAQTATVTYDSEQTSVADLRRVVGKCSYHCAGESVPTHVSMPTTETAPAHAPIRLRRLPHQCAHRRK
jgi:Cu2+-exporting ATPase